MYYDPVGQVAANQSMLFASFFTNVGQGITTVLPKDSVTVSKFGSRTINPRVDIQQVTWDWCERNYSKTIASPGRVLESSYTFEYLDFDESDTRNIDGYYPYITKSSSNVYQIAYATREGMMRWILGFMNTTQW